MSENPVGRLFVAIETKLLLQAVKFIEAGRVDEANVLCDEAIAVAPESGEAWYVKGILSERRGEMANAVSAHENAVSFDADSERNNISLVGILAKVGRVADAIVIVEQLLEKAPERADLRTILSGLKLTVQDYAGGESEARQAIDLDSCIPEAHLNLALILYQTSRMEEALAACNAAIAADESFVSAYFTAGTVQLALGQHVAAMNAYNKVLELEPAHAEALLNLGNIHREHLDIAVAGTYYERAVAAAPGNAAAHSNLGIVYKDQGRMEAALSAFKKAVELDPTMHQARSNLLFCLCFKTDECPYDVLAEHKIFDELHARPLLPDPLEYSNVRDPNRRLRIGLISPDCRIHPGGHFFLPIVEGLNRADFEVYCYYNYIVRDDWTERFECSSDHFYHVVHWNDDQLTDQIRADKIDILMEGAGHMSGNRLLAVARKPAPIQVGWPLYPNTTGLSAVDYRVVDRHSALPSADEFCTEEIIRLPDTHFCYRPLERDVEPSAYIPRELNGYVTFGSFNNAIKLSDLTVETWAAILKAVPQSRLVLKWLEFDQVGASGILDRFAEHGVDPERIIRQGWADDPYTPYGQLDICLDPLLTSGGTTTCDALWMGVPVITFAGESIFSRTGVMHLTNIGLPELSATDVKQYVQIAADLAGDGARLSAIRSGLRDKIRQSPIMNEAAYCKVLGEALRHMWRRWCER